MQNLYFKDLRPKLQPAILTFFQNIHTQVSILNLPFLPPHLLIKVKYQKYCCLGLV